MSAQTPLDAYDTPLTITGSSGTIAVSTATMNHFLRAFTVMFALIGTGVYGGAGTAFAAAGAPPNEPIETPKNGADLKHACGQNVEGFSELVGEQILRAMLIVQCRAMVAAVVELVNNGQYVVDDTPVWQCVKDREDLDALAATYVKWVGRRPALLRKPASMAFVEAIEMSAKCRK